MSGNFHLNADTQHWISNIRISSVGKQIRIQVVNTHTHTHQTQTGNLGVDPVSAARLDKGDYPPCGELGARFSVCVCVSVYVYTDTCFLRQCALSIPCFPLMCVCAKCVCVPHCWGELCHSIPRSRKEGLSGFSKWDFRQDSRKILLSRLHPLTSGAKGGFPGSWHLAYWVHLMFLRADLHDIGRYGIKVKVKGLGVKKRGWV